MSVQINTAGKLILIVDDVRDIQESYSKFLQHEGFRVVVAGDGQEALDKAFELCPDLIIMDLFLPIINGRSATRQLKENQSTKNIPVVISTAYSSEGTQAVISLGCEGFLMKPTAPRDLLKEIVRVLKRSNRAE